MHLFHRYSKFSILIAFLLLACLRLAPESSAISPVSGQAEQSARQREEFFEQKIRPLLAAQCYDCHTTAESGGLRMDSREALLKGGASGPAIAPGNADGSLLIQAVSHTHSKLKMPKGAPKLNDDQIADLRHWVNDGAYWPAGSASAKSLGTEYVITPQQKGHWAFQPIRRPHPPTTTNRQWPLNEIDRFILAKLEAGGLRPNPRADKRTLLRRATLDLTGLPPTPEEVAAFLADPSPEAFAKVIQRLLASPRYGERWGRHWLDVARYSDTMGINDTTILLFPFAYTYRDWVIRAFNEDLPYGQFLTQQLAADLMPKNDSRNLAALGYLTLGRGGFSVPTEEYIDDKVDVAIRGTMALTVSCARCHNHKFDPIPTADYYSLYSIFANTRNPEERPLLEPAAANSEKELELKKERAKIDEEIANYRQKRFPELKADYRKPETIAKYLMATWDARDLKKEAELKKLSEEKDYNLYMLGRWRQFLKRQAETDNPIFALWQALTALSEKEFADKAATVTRSLTGANAVRKLNPLVAAEFSQSPASLRAAAEAYGKLIAKYDRTEAFPDANEEGLRLVLHGEDAPPNFPFKDFENVQLVKDEQFEYNQKQKLEGVILARAFDGASPRAMATEDLPTPVPGHIFVRGNPNNKGAEVPRRFLQILAGDHRQLFTHGSGRLELAEAITERSNPLTARVIVNRVWQWHFGQGLVRTPSDFGARGDAPTHPELLDFLAGWFMDNGWSIKKLHVLIMQSRTYQQSSADNPVARGRDPENKLLWRMNRQRLDFESLRDSMLAASGQLDATMGGVPDEITAWPFSRRRTVYAFINRVKLAGEFNTFDFANPDAHVAQRYQTTIPQQSLYLMNSPFVIEQARALVRRPEIAADPNPRQRIRKLYRLLYGREASAEEIAWGVKFVGSGAGSAPRAVATVASSNAWQYGQGEYDDATKKLKSFTDYKFFAAGAWRLNANEFDPRKQTAFLNREGGIPAGGKAGATVRRWVAPFDGKVAISGKLIHEFEQACVTCDGVEAVIISGRQGALGNWTAYLSQAETTVASVEVKRGDTIDFLTHGKKNSSGDDFKWKVAIRRIEPVRAGAEKTDWDSVRDFDSPLNRPMNAWEKYAQALLAAVEFQLID